MSDKDLARRVRAELSFDGVNITDSVRKYFLSLTYTDNEEDEADDLQLNLHDREGIWLTQWLNDAVQASASIKGMRVNASIIRENWNGDGIDFPLDCGQFELDTVDASGPPATIAIKSTALPFSSQIRQTKKSRAWESIYLSGIAKEIATKNGMSCIFDSTYNPYYKRKEQSSQSDIAFLSRLAHDAGLSLKITNNTIVLFDQRTYEAMEPVLTIKRGKAGGYTKYKLTTGEADRMYASCRVRYVDPGTGKVIQATAYVEDYDKEAENNQQLEITAKVSSIGEAKALAEKHLRLRNKFEKSVSFTFPFNPALMAGCTVVLEDWGAWSGKYIIKQAKHTVGSSGSTTQIQLRPVLGGY